MSTYLKFLRVSSKNTDRQLLNELRVSLEKDHTSFLLGLKTASHLLSVKSGEVQCRSRESERIWRHFNDPLPEELEEFLEDLEEESVEELLVEVTKLLEETASVGLRPIVNKLGPGCSVKEFYQRTIALLINLSLESKKKYGKYPEESPPITRKRMSYKLSERWRLGELRSNVTFNLCRLSVAISIFGTEEAGLFTSFSEIPASLLGLFSSELWVYLLGSMPTLCYDPKYLFSLNSIKAYVGVVTDQYYGLLQNLLRSIYFDGEIGSRGNLLMLCNWIDFIYKNASNNRELWTQKGEVNQGESTWVSTLLDNKLVADVMYEVMKFEPSLCMETVVKLAEVNENLTFVENIVFGPEIKVEVSLELLNKLDLQVLSKDAITMRNILTYMLEGTKGKTRPSFVKLWKRYLNQYRKVKMNRQVIEEGLRKLAKQMMEEWYQELEYPRECFNLENTNKEANKNKSKAESRDQVFLYRNLFRSLIKVVGCKEYETKFKETIERGYQIIQSGQVSGENIEKVEFAMFLIYGLDLREKYREAEEVKVNDAKVMFNVHMIQKKDKEVDLEEESRIFVKFYNIENMIKANKKKYVGQLSRLMANSGGTENREMSKKNKKTKGQLFRKLVKRYTKNIVGSILGKFPELAKETLGKSKTYMNYTMLYLRVYKEVKRKEDIKEPEEESKEWNKYQNMMEKVVLNGIAILIKYPHLVVQYKDLINILIKMDLHKYLRLLESSSKTSQILAWQIIQNVKEERKNYMELTKKFIVETEKTLTAKGIWSDQQLELFEKVLKIVTKLMEKVENISELMTEKRGQWSLKNIIVMANGLATKEKIIRKRTNKLNIALLDLLLEINQIYCDEGSKGRTNKLRSYEYARKQLKEILTSSCGRFEIMRDRGQEKLALGSLTVMDLMIYQSFAQVFGNQREITKREKEGIGRKGVNENEIKLNNDDLNKKRVSYKRNLDGSKKESKDQNLRVNRLNQGNVTGLDRTMALEFIGKMFAGYNDLPNNKLALISEFFFNFASLRTNKKTQEIKKRFLADSSKITPDVTELLYELNRAIESNSIF